MDENENKVEVVESTKKGIMTIIKEFFAGIGSWLWSRKGSILKGTALFAAGVAAGNTIFSGLLGGSDGSYDEGDYAEDEVDAVPTDDDLE